jgi:hypothetical protein
MRTAGPTLRLVNNGATNDIIDNALVRYHDYLFSEVTGGLSQWLGPTPGAPPRRCSNHSGATSTKALALEQLSVHVKNVSAAAFGMDGDESYVLDIPASGDAVLVANTPVGALRGLETFSQLFLLTREECHYRIPLVPIHVDTATITRTRTAYHVPRIIASYSYVSRALCWAMLGRTPHGGRIEGCLWTQAGIIRA